jgi:hypothetical protein
MLHTSSSPADRAVNGVSAPNLVPVAPPGRSNAEPVLLDRPPAQAIMVPIDRGNIIRSERELLAGPRPARLSLSLPAKAPIGLVVDAAAFDRPGLGDPSSALLRPVPAASGSAPAALKPATDDAAHPVGTSSDLAPALPASDVPDLVRSAVTSFWQAVPFWRSWLGVWLGLLGAALALARCRPRRSRFATILANLAILDGVALCEEDSA